jgi:hypothetical protein
VSFAVVWLFAIPPLEQTVVESLRVGALNPVDGLAVVQETDGDLRTLHLGDDVSDLLTVSGSLKITKILEDRLVVEGILSSGIKTKLWIYKAAPGDKSSRVVVLEGRTKSERRASPRKEHQ